METTTHRQLRGSTTLGRQPKRHTRRGKQKSCDSGLEEHLIGGMTMSELDNCVRRDNTRRRVENRRRVQ